MTNHSPVGLQQRAVLRIGKVWATTIRVVAELPLELALLIVPLEFVLALINLGLCNWLASLIIGTSPWLVVVAMFGVAILWLLQQIVVESLVLPVVVGMVLRLARGEKASLDLALRQLVQKAVLVVGTAAAYRVLSRLATALCGVPAIWVTAQFGMAVPIAADDAGSVKEAFAASQRLLEGKRGTFVACRAFVVIGVLIQAFVLFWTARPAVPPYGFLEYWFIVLLLTGPGTVVLVLSSVSLAVMYVHLRAPEGLLVRRENDSGAAEQPAEAVAVRSEEPVAASPSVACAPVVTVPLSPSIPDLAVELKTTTVPPTPTLSEPAPPRVAPVSAPPRRVAPVSSELRVARRNRWILFGSITTVVLVVVGAVVIWFAHYYAERKREVIQAGAAVGEESQGGKCVADVQEFLANCPFPYCRYLARARVRACLEYLPDEKKSCESALGLTSAEERGVFIKAQCAPEEDKSVFCAEYYEALSDRCVRLASEQRNPAACVAMKRPLRDLVHDDLQCIEKRAVANGSLNACKAVPTDGYKSVCYRAIARAQKDPGACGAIPLARERRSCIAVLAQETNDLKLCGLVGESEEMDECLSDLAWRSDLSQCNRISDISRRKTCLTHIGPKSPADCESERWSARVACYARLPGWEKFSLGDCSLVGPARIREECVTTIATRNQSPQSCTALTDADAQRRCQQSAAPKLASCEGLPAAARSECEGLLRSLVRGEPRDCVSHSNWRKACVELHQKIGHQ